MRDAKGRDKSQGPGDAAERAGVLALGRLFLVLSTQHSPNRNISRLRTKLSVASMLNAAGTRFSKRKATARALGARKKPRTQIASAEALPWKAVARRTDVVDDADEGLLDLEEVEDVEVVYEETPAGRVARFKVSAILSLMGCISSFITGRRRCRGQHTKVSECRIHKQHNRESSSSRSSSLRQSVQSFCSENVLKERSEDSPTGMGCTRSSSNPCA
jgi:hypothetical protein